MLFVLDLIDMVYVAGSAAAGTSMYPVQVYDFPPALEASAPVQMVRKGYRADGRGECVFNGTMVP